MQQAGFTTTAPNYPGYVNFLRQADGSVVVTLRAAPKIRNGAYICARASDAGPGRCVPGEPTCNNYCNMHPDKNMRMADHPRDCLHVIAGDQASLVVPAEAWEQLLEQFAGGGK